ncbi:MAG TPA: PIN domain-containing protein [Gemmataceae bacterium]|nr:PIN domain-containing protein [Gemmataceae bacterium]
MALICDTGAIYALYDADDVHHAAAKAVVEAEIGPLFLPIVLLAEIDYLLTSRLGTDAALDFLESIESGSFVLVIPSSEDLSRCRELIAQYRDLPLGLADATVAATAERLKIQRVFTVDVRHFRTIQPRGLGHFIVLPADKE